MISRLSKHGAQLVGEVVQYGDSHRLCYIRGTEGLLIGLVEQLVNKCVADVFIKVALSLLWWLCRYPLPLSAHGFLHVKKD